MKLAGPPLLGRPVARAQGRGFTLIEVLIGMALLSLLMLVLTGAMRSMGQTETRIEQRVQAADDYRTAVYFLRGILSQASAHTTDMTAQGGSRRAVFLDAQASQLAWIGVMPARHGLGGRHYFRLAIESGLGHAPRLVLRYAAWTGDASFPDWTAADAQVLADGARRLALQYQNPLNGEWLDHWPPPDAPRSLSLPSAVALYVEHADAAPWPLIVAPMRAAFVSDENAMNDDFGPGPQ